jgi:hypothetical protein
MLEAWYVRVVSVNIKKFKWLEESDIKY